jgi:hypothetical protein
MTYRIFLDNVLLNNLPLGLDSFKKEFVRDNNLFGLYSLSSFDLIFIGDGFCNLKKFQENTTLCEKEVLIQQYCNNNWVDIFNGIINIGSIKINEELKQAECEIQDNSPLAILSRNSELSIDLESEKGVFGQTITPASVNPSILDGIDFTSYDTKNVSWYDALRVVTEAITNTTVNVSSTFLNTVPQEQIYRLVFTGTVANITSINITYKNFQGETKTFFADNSGNGAIANLIRGILNQAVALGNLSTWERAFTTDIDYRYFYRHLYDAPTKTLSLYSTLPIDILSMSITGSTAVGVTYTKTQEFVDGGDEPCFLNYNTLMNQVAPYGLQYSFKEIMEELNKAYNVYFIATYNNAGEIDLKLVSYYEIIGTNPNLTLDNVTKLTYQFDDQSIYNTLKTNDAPQQALLQKERVFTSDFCGIGNQLDLSNSFILGTVPTLKTIRQVYDDSLLNNKYIITKNGTSSFFEAVYLAGLSGYLILSANIINKFLTNWHKVYRHLPKFANNIIGNASYYNPTTNNFSVNIYNNTALKTFKTFTFNAIISNIQFNSLSDNILDMVKFKRESDTSYRYGLVKSVTYNYNTGEAEFTILGE